MTIRSKEVAGRSTAFLDIEFSPAWQFIDDVRRFVEAFCYNMKVDGDRATTVGLTVHELLQNALHYSIDGWAAIRIEVNWKESQVDITSRSRSRPEQIDRLSEIVRRMEAEPDPLKHYLALMHETVKRAEGSGLGLARIRFEARMELKVDIKDNAVCVHAWGALNAPTLLEGSLPEGANRG